MQTGIFREIVSIAKLHLCYLFFHPSTLFLGHAPHEDCTINSGRGRRATSTDFFTVPGKSGFVQN